MTIAKARLKSFVERIERLESERKDLAADIREVYSEAKGAGFDVKILRKVVALRRQEDQQRLEEAVVLETYLAALGMQLELGLGDAEREAAE